MNALAQRIATLIETSGAISVAEYMAMCLFDPTDGYYTTREPFGVKGDFTTAPEVSQMFGELVAVWLFAAWRASGNPLPCTFAEIGPGRGTLMKDIMRSLARLDKRIVDEASFALVEASPRLTRIQVETLADAPAVVSWHETVETLPPLPLFIVGNELFDAIPIRQFVKMPEGWRERLVALDDDRKLRFVAGLNSLDPSLLPSDAAAAPEGAIVELAPARGATMASIAAPIAQRGGAGLFFDYGYLEPGIGDTLQAMRRHAYADVLAEPGEADLTAHVDFAGIAASAQSHGLVAHTATQGDFLLGMGLLERAGALGAGFDDAGRERVRSEVERLAGEDQMGRLFKVLAIVPRGVAVPGFSS